MSKFQKIVLPSRHFPLDVALESFQPCKPYFSKVKARPFQEEIIGILRTAIEERGTKYIFLQLPTGAGKSVIGTTIAEYFRREHNKDYYVLATDHGLTAQYKRENEFLKEVKGRANFNCILHRHEHLKASEAPCVIRSGKKAFDCPVKEDCPYIKQRNEAVQSFGTLSTPYYIDLCTPGQIFEKRFLAIRDEAHKLESFYLGLLEVYLTDYDYKIIHPMGELPQYNDDNFWFQETGEMIDIIGDKIEKGVLEDDIVKYEKLQSKLILLHRLLSMHNNVVIDVETNRRGKAYILFRPVKASTYAKDYIDGVAEHTIFMSATFLSIKDRCDQLGIPMNEVLYINFKKSIFPNKNRHFIPRPCGSMSYKQREKTIPKIIIEAGKIIKEHENKRGIIICASHKIRDTIYKGLQKIHKHPDYLITHTGAPGSFNRNFEKFLERRSKPLVFITTRYEGLDFYGKLAEWMIYTNLPYAPPMDKQVAARLRMEQQAYIEINGGSCGYEEDNYGMCKKGAYCHNCRRWYDLKVAEAFQQAIGRIIRTKEDVGYLYILDSRFQKFYEQNEDLFLSFIRDTIDKEWMRKKR